MTILNFFSSLFGSSSDTCSQNSKELRSASTSCSSPVVEVSKPVVRDDAFYARMTMERLLDHTAQPFSWTTKRDAYPVAVASGDYVEFLAKYHDLASVRAIYTKKLLNR